jgi:hypothetical protein
LQTALGYLSVQDFTILGLLYPQVSLVLDAKVEVTVNYLAELSWLYYEASSFECLLTRVSHKGIV